MDQYRPNTACESIGLLNARSIAALVCFVAFGVLATALSLPGPGAGFGLFVCIGVALLMAVIARRTRLVIHDGWLEVGAFPYRRRVCLRDLDPSGIREIDAGDPFRLRWRLNGIGLPGMCLGSFSTNAGKPVFAAVSGRHGRVFIPTRLNYDLVVTVADPGRLIARFTEP